MRLFSVKPTLSIKGRKSKGLRGFAGKPTHPPLTDVPIGAYVLVAILDVMSFIGGETDWARSLWHTGTFILAIGVIASVPTALTGLVDRQTSSEPGTQAWRTINTHALIMVIVTLAAIANTAWRWTSYNDHAFTPVGIMILSVATLLFGAIGATFGGSLVFDYGFNVETAGDHPVWHKSEEDVFHHDN
ncbi:MAG TPA: DUF2231 domain-containing protein [Microthrixaceae bacterium]|nr:DUF2231 domain-containing protein [Microthrixaceae bacterium]